MVTRLLLVVLALGGLARPVRADALDDVRAREAEVRTLGEQRAELDALRAQLERESQALAAEVERAKAESAGVRRDLKLGDLLAGSRAKADQLERVAQELRARSTQLAAARRTLVSACDRALKGGQDAEAIRLKLERLRTAQVTLLAAPEQPVAVGHAAADPLDGPRELEEKADLLRDSEDKLKREAERLATRIDDAERRRHLRERAASVDEDWFSEVATNRKSASVSKSVGANPFGRGATGDTNHLAGTPTPPPSPTGGPGAGSSPPATPGPTPAPGVSNNNVDFKADTTTTLRNLVDPATLDELKRADGGDDVDRQIRALRRAQNELEGLARELDRRARALSTRADELKHRK